MRCQDSRLRIRSVIPDYDGKLLIWGGQGLLARRERRKGSVSCDHMRFPDDLIAAVDLLLTSLAMTSLGLNPMTPFRWRRCRLLVTDYYDLIFLKFNLS